MDHVSKTYSTFKKTGLFRKIRHEVPAVCDLSLSLKPGEIIGLLGLNGAGKTTTIKMLATLLTPSGGCITVDGLDINTHRRTIQARINVITGSERLLYWRLTGRENLAYFGRLYGLPEPLLRSRSRELLEEVGLTEAADLPVEQYSKGMKQRLQIARGLINDPSYVLLDEPTIGLDAPVARHLRGMIKRLAQERGKGILLTSHYLQEVEELCSRVYVMDRGRLMLSDTPQAIIRQAAGCERLVLTAAGALGGLAERLACAFGLAAQDVAVSAEPEVGGGVGGAPGGTIAISAEAAGSLAPALLPWLAGQGVEISGLAVEKPTLEDAILALAAGKGESRHHEQQPVLASLPG